MKMKIFLTVSAIIIVLVSDAQGTWNQKNDFGGTERELAVGFSIGTKGYIGTGTNANGVYYNDFWEWDQTTGTWTQMADFGGAARSAATGFSIGSKGYIGSGTGASNYKDFWEWDQGNNVWSQKSDIGGSIMGHGAVGFSIGNKGYIGTGFKSSSPYITMEFWEWDQANDTWTQKADFGGGNRQYAVGFSIGTKGYIGTGYNGISYTQDFWEWDQTSDTWSAKTSFPGTGRASAVGFSIGNKGYLGNGNNGFNLQDFWEWDQTNDSWSQKSNVGGLVKGAGAVGFSIGGKGYVGTGGSEFTSSSINTKDFWEFDPSVITSLNKKENESFVLVHPNPSSGNFILEVPLGQKTSIKISNAIGKIIYSAEINSNRYEIDLSKEKKGTYFIHLSNQNEIINKKIIIQ